MQQLIFKHFSNESSESHTVVQEPQPCLASSHLWQVVGLDCVPGLLEQMKDNWSPSPCSPEERTGIVKLQKDDSHHSSTCLLVSPKFKSPNIKDFRKLNKSWHLLYIHVFYYIDYAHGTYFTANQQHHCRETDSSQTTPYSNSLSLIYTSESPLLICLLYFEMQSANTKSGKRKVIALVPVRHHLEVREPKGNRES